MPLLVGHYMEKENFTEQELEFACGFKLGSASAVTGCGDCRDPLVFLNRLKVVWPLFDKDYDKDSPTYGEGRKLPEFVNLELIERMKEAGWSTNAAGWHSEMQFAINLSYHLLSDHVVKYHDPSMVDEDGHTWRPYESLRGNSRKGEQLEQAVININKERFWYINPHKAYDKVTINPKDYDSDGWLIEQ